MVRFSVIIPSKDRNSILNKTIKALKAVVNFSSLEIIIVNDSDQPVILEGDTLPGNIVITKSPGNGVAAARNFGASVASSEWLVFMDDDMLVQPETFTRIVPLCEKIEKNCLNVNWIYPENVRLKRKQDPFLRYLNKFGFDSLEGWSSDVVWNHKELFKVKSITSQFLVIHKDIFSKLGGYNTSFPFAGFEDHDLSNRIRRNNINIYLDPTNTIYHNEEDRLNVEQWLERKKRGAITRKVAVSLGYKDLALNYVGPKKYIYEVLIQIKKLLIAFLKYWPATTVFDRLYFLIVNTLLGTYSYMGYSKTQKHS